METLKQMIDEVVEIEKFIIDTDNKAEWSLLKIKEEREETQKIIKTCESMIEYYKEKIEEEKERLRNKTSFLENQLLNYFMSKERKRTKTQETYKLPSGILKLKYKAPELKRNDDELLKWIKENNKKYLKVTESVNWSELKKEVIISESHGKVITLDGEVLECIKVIEQQPEFKIEI